MEFIAVLSMLLVIAAYVWEERAKDSDSEWLDPNGDAEPSPVAVPGRRTRVAMVVSGLLWAIFLGHSVDPALGDPALGIERSWGAVAFLFSAPIWGGYCIGVAALAVVRRFDVQLPRVRHG